MAKKTVPDMKELFRQAAEIAQQVPENMQEAAFNRALDLLVEESEPAVGDKTPKGGYTPTGERARPQKTPHGGGDLLHLIDSTQHPGVASATKVLDQSLMVLQIALRNHSTDGLTAVEIARVLTEKFRLPTTRQAVGMALKNASNLVDRVPEGRGYRYRIMNPGEEYLSHLEENRTSDQPFSSPPAAKKRPSRRSNKSTAAPKKATGSKRKKSSGKRGAEAKRPAKRPSPGKLGPKAAILELIKEGFFASPKGGPEVQAHLKKKRGYDLGTDQLRLAMLRLVRDGVMERDENDEGQYEYKQA